MPAIAFMVWGKVMVTSSGNSDSTFLRRTLLRQ
jgi:hypothetical protein